MPAQPKPKFGHAAHLFADHGSMPSRLFGLNKIKLKHWGGHFIAAVFLFVVAGTVVAGQAPDVQDNTTANSTSTPLMQQANINVVQSTDEDRKLVGTLIHAGEPNHSELSGVDADKPITLDPQERQRLLEIISN